ncbi:MAG: helix-turn-helix domain-containing protein [Pyrodictiaceae archaeon]
MDKSQVNAIRVRLTLDNIAVLLLKSGNRYITAKRLAAMLGISTRTAGRILSLMKEQGLIEKWSRKTYRIPGLNIDSRTSKGALLA